MSAINTLPSAINASKSVIDTNFSNLNTDKLESTDLKTVNWNSLVWSGDIVISGWSGTLAWLTDVDIATPANGEIISYNSSSSKWENVPLSGGGDMLTSTYDPTNVSWDAFDMENMVEGATNKILTTAERTKLTNTSGTNSGDQTSIVGITGTKAQFDTACTDGNFLYSGDIISASTTVQGIVELATTAEIDTGTDSTRAMPVNQFVASKRNVRYFDIYAIEKATDNAVGTNIIGAIECPFTWTITEIGAYVETAGVTGASVWDVNKNGTTIMTTNKLSIDSAEVSTRTSATAPTLTTTAITAGDLITIDTDSLSTTKPKGLHIRIWIRQS